jgi:AraC-like DNA-binding protein
MPIKPNLVRAASLTHYVEVARAVGLDPWRMLAEAGLNRTCIDNPDLRISVDAANTLLERSAALSGEEAFGLRMAEGRRISNLGVLGLMLREQPTLRLAMQSVRTYGRLQNEALFQHVEEANGIATIYEHLLLNRAGGTRQAAELVIAVGLRALRLFLGNEWNARRICFTHSEPASLAVHRRVLGQTPEFGCDFNAIVCSSADLDTRIATADPVMADFLSRQLKVDAGRRAMVADEVRRMALVLLPLGRCAVEQVAGLMGVSRRTVCSQLAREGTSFSDIVCAMRRELARRYLSEGQLSLTDISGLLGFRDLSSFSRWHKLQFGGSPLKQRGRG